MKIIVVGGGKIGETLVEQLAKEGHDLGFDAITSKRSLRKPKTGLTLWESMGTALPILCRSRQGCRSGSSDRRYQFGRAEYALLPGGKKLGARHTIARIRNPEYNDQLVFLREELGLSLSINPEAAAAGSCSGCSASPRR